MEAKSGKVLKVFKRDFQIKRKETKANKKNSMNARLCLSVLKEETQKWIRDSPKEEEEGTFFFLSDQSSVKAVAFSLAPKLFLGRPKNFLTFSGQWTLFVQQHNPSSVSKRRRENWFPVYKVKKRVFVLCCTGVLEAVAVPANACHYVYMKRRKYMLPPSSES